MMRCWASFCMNPCWSKTQYTGYWFLKAIQYTGYWFMKAMFRRIVITKCDGRIVSHTEAYRLECVIVK